MSNFSPESFFDLSHFAHSKIFTSCQNVWEVLPLISKYLKSLELGRIEVEIPQGAFIEDRERVSIGEGTVVEPGAYIRGPCIIGKNCTIRHGAYIRGDLIAGDNCIIGHDTEVKNAIILNGARAGHFAYLGDSILGNDVNLGAGTICANLKLDHKGVIVHSDGQRYETGLKKFGAIIGDGVQTGCHTVLNPGTLIGKGSWCYPGLNFGGVIPPQHVVKSNTAITIKPIKS